MSLFGAIKTIFQKKDPPPPPPPPTDAEKKEALRKSNRNVREYERLARRGQGPFDLNEMFEGEHGKSYKITSMLRNPGPHAHYYVKLGDRDEYFLRLGRKGRKKMHHMAEILKAQKDANKESKSIFFLEVVEVGSTAKYDYLITTPRPGLEVYEIFKYHLKIRSGWYEGGKWGPPRVKPTYHPSTIVRNLDSGTIMNIGLRTLECIRALHNAGYISRNVKLASFSIGIDKDRTVQICMSDFRIARKHLDDATGEPRPPRDRVRFTGTLRYASRNAMREKEQGRKDDLESWFLMLDDMVHRLPWQKLTSRQKVLKAKDDYFDKVINGHLSTAYRIIRDLINSLTYETKPDYDKIIELIEIARNNEDIGPDMMQWPDKYTDWTSTYPVIRKSAVRSVDNLCVFEDEDENSEFSIRRKQKPELAERHKLEKRDKFQSGTHLWTGNRCLRSGTWGDVYVVYDANEKNKGGRWEWSDGELIYPCQMKIENEANKKSCNRLITEMKVYMAIQKAASIASGNKPASRSSKRVEYFPELLDSGRSVELKSRFIVTKYVGLTMEGLRKKNRVDLGFKDLPYRIASQTLEAIRRLHTLGFIHRNIKPSSFSFEIDYSRSIYMTDFGRCKQFDERNTKEHRTSRSSKKVKMVGSLRFASRDCMRCLEHSRQDDLESWLYMVFDIFDEEHGCAWKMCEDRDVILAKKVEFFQDKLSSVYQNVPLKMKTIVKYIDSLDYQTSPDYELIQKELKTITHEAGYDLEGKISYGTNFAKQFNIKEEGFDDGSVSEDEETIETNESE